MHICTVVRVKADDPEEAVEKIKSLLTSYGEYTFVGDGHDFDWLDEDATQISKDIKTEEDFTNLRENEKKEALRLQREANRKKGEDKGYYLKKAGECLTDYDFWSTERQAYDAAYQGDNDCSEGKHVYFVDTDRHS